MSTSKSQWNSPEKARVVADISVRRRQIANRALSILNQDVKNEVISSPVFVGVTSAILRYRSSEVQYPSRVPRFSANIQSEELADISLDAPGYAALVLQQATTGLRHLPDNVTMLESFGTPPVDPYEYYGPEDDITPAS